MGLGIRKIKIEMTGTGGGRWMRRAEAKSISKKARRLEDRRQLSPERKVKTPTG